MKKITAFYDTVKGKGAKKAREMVLRRRLPHNEAGK